MATSYQPGRQLGQFKVQALDVWRDHFRMRHRDRPAAALEDRFAAGVVNQKLRFLKIVGEAVVHEHLQAKRIRAMENISRPLAGHRHFRNLRDRDIIKPCAAADVLRVKGVISQPRFAAKLDGLKQSQFDHQELGFLGRWRSARSTDASIPAPVGAGIRIGLHPGVLQLVAIDIGEVPGHHRPGIGQRRGLNEALNAIMRLRLNVNQPDGYR